MIRGAQYSTAADIYSFGMLMYYVAIGRHPFVEKKNDIHLALDICNGIRPPMITNNIPDQYKELMQQCWDADLSKRPNAEQLVYYFAGEYEKTVQASDYGTELVTQTDVSVYEDDIKQSSIYEFHDLLIPRNATLGNCIYTLLIFNILNVLT